MLIATKNNFDDTCMVLDTNDGVEENVDFDNLRANPSVVVAGISEYDLDMGVLSPIRIKWVSDNFISTYRYDGFYFDDKNTYSDINYYDLNITYLNLSKDEFEKLVDIIQKRAENKILVPTLGNYKDYPIGYEVVGDVDYNTGLIGTTCGDDLSYFSVLGIILDEKKTVKGLTEVTSKYVIINGQTLSAVDYMYSLYKKSINKDCYMSSNSYVDIEDGSNNINKLLLTSSDLNVFLNMNDNYYTISKHNIPLHNLLDNIRQLELDTSDAIYVGRPELQRNEVGCYSIGGNNITFEDVLKYYYNVCDDELKQQIDEDEKMYSVKMKLANLNYNGNAGRFGHSFDIDCVKRFNNNMGYGKFSLTDIQCFDFYGKKFEIHNVGKEFKGKGIVSSRLTRVGWIMFDFFDCDVRLGNSSDSYNYFFRDSENPDNNSNMINYIINRGFERGIVCNYDTIIPMMFSKFDQVMLDSEPYLVPYVCCLTVPNLEKNKDKYGDGWDAAICFGFIEVPILCLSTAIYEQSDMYVIETALQKMYLQKDLIEYLAINSLSLQVPYSSSLDNSKQAKIFRVQLDKVVSNSFI